MFKSQNISEHGINNLLFLSSLKETAKKLPPHTLLIKMEQLELIMFAIEMESNMNQLEKHSLTHQI